MRKILMMAAYILLTLQCVGVYAGGKLPLEYGNKNLVVHEDTVKKDTVKKATAYEKLLKDGGSECSRSVTSKMTGILKYRILYWDDCYWLLPALKLFRKDLKCLVEKK